MKTLLAASLVATFAFVASVQAGDNVEKKKAAASPDQAKSDCAAKASSCADKTASCAEKVACCAEKVAKKADVSVKGATLLLVRR